MIWLEWLWLFAVLAAMASMARLDPFTRGTIVGLRAAGVTRDDIVQRVKKKDGKRPTLRAVDSVLARHREEPAWRGEDSRAGGRPSLLTAKERKLLLNLVLAERGKAKVTVPYCRRRLPFLRKVSENTVRRELFAAGLAYLRRRGKTAVPKEFRKQRLVYCRWTLRQSASDLRRYAYTDGTTFYLARGPAENHHKQRAAPAGVRDDALQDLVPDCCRPAREPLGNSWPRRSWGAIRSVKHRVTPGCRADGCTNPVLPLRCRNQKVRNHKTIILLLKMRAVNAKLHNLCSHPRDTQASPDVLSNGSLPMAAALTY